MTTATKTATAMTIVATRTARTGDYFESFTFDDGITVRQHGGIICSAHGRKHCRHHKAAHTAILTAAFAKLAAAATAAADAYFTAVIEQAPDPEYDASLATLPVSHPLPEDF